MTWKVAVAALGDLEPLNNSGSLVSTGAALSSPKEAK
jgi:hypothetical protein